MITADLIVKAMDVRSQIDAALEDCVRDPVRGPERARAVIGDIIVALAESRSASRCAGAGCCGGRR